MRLRSLTLTAVAAAALLMAGPITAQPAEEDRVVLTANGTAVLESDVLSAIENLPPQLQQMPPQVLLPQIAEQLAMGVLIADVAQAEGLLEDADVIARIARAQRGILQGVWLERRLDAEITSAVLDEAYQSYLTNNPAEDEVSARHILVETSEEAIAVIERLDAGEDFAGLAAEVSVGPSGPNGGDLGFFTQAQMVAPFAEAAFTMEPGTYSAEPVQTQFGWHVILVEDRRAIAQPSLAELEPQLRQGLEGELLQEIFAELRADAEIIYFDASGNPVEGEGAAATQ